MTAAISRPGTRRRIIRDTDAERAGQDAIHPGVRGQDRAPRFEALTQLGLQVPGDRDHDRCRLEMRQVIDELKLLFWSQGGLEDDHLVAGPGAGTGVGRANSLDRHSEPPGCCPQPLLEHEFVGDNEQTASHGCRISG
jgi:hypothetical protein